jgi:hypothetical protein
MANQGNIGDVVDSAAVLLCLVALGALSACVTASPYQPLGELPQGRATFDAQSVRSSRQDIYRRQDGTWAGRILGRVVEVEVSDHQVCIGGSSGACLEWEERPEGLLMTRRGVEKYLVITCAVDDRECGYAPTFQNPQDEIDHLCPEVGCNHVLHWRPFVAARGPEVLVPLMIALYSGL